MRFWGRFEMSEQCPAPDCAIPETAETSPEMSTTVWWMMWTGLLEYVIPRFLVKFFSILATNALETEFSILCSIAAVAVLLCEVGRLSLLRDRVLKEIYRWREYRRRRLNAEQGQSITDNPALSLSVTDVQVYDTRVVMAAGILGGSSTWSARLASYAVLPLDESDERWNLALLWSAITWVFVGVIYRGLEQETADWTALTCVIATAGTCLGPLQRTLIAFTPVSRCGDFLCCVGIAALHAVCVVYAGRYSNAALGLMCSLLLWLCLAAALVTLRPPVQEKVAGSAKDEVERKLAIEALCKKTEEVALDLSSTGFSPRELLREYLNLEGTRNDIVMRVLVNQISNAERTMLRASSTAVLTNNALPPLKESKRVHKVYFAGGDKVSIGELLPKTRDPRTEGRIFVVANVQRPTVIGVTEKEAGILLIAGKSDVVRHNSDAALFTRGMQEVSVDMDEVEAMSSYRRRLLQIVEANDRESWGPIRSGWSATVELYLLANASSLMAGWSIVHRTAEPQPIRAPMFLVAAIFSAFMGLMQQADYQAAPRLLDRWTYCLRVRGMHLSARNTPARTNTVWIFMTLGFSILSWQVSRGENENISEVLQKMYQDVLPQGGAKMKESGAEGVFCGAQGSVDEEGDCPYCRDWVYGWLWLGCYWVIWLVDVVLSHQAGREGRLGKSFSLRAP